MCLRYRLGTVFSFCVVLPLCSVRSCWSLRHGVWVNDWYATRMYINMGKQCTLHWNHVISTWVDVINTTDVISTWEVPVPYRVFYQGVEFGRGTNSGKVASKQWSFLRRNCGRHGLDLEEDLSVTVWQPLLSLFSLLFNSWNVNVESLSFPLYRVNIVCCSFSVVRVFHVLLLFLWLKTFFCCLFRDAGLISWRLCISLHWLPSPQCFSRFHQAWTLLCISTPRIYDSWFVFLHLHWA